MKKFDTLSPTDKVIFLVSIGTLLSSIVFLSFLRPTSEVAFIGIFGLALLSFSGMLIISNKYETKPKEQTKNGLSILFSGFLLGLITFGLFVIHFHLHR